MVGTGPIVVVTPGLLVLVVDVGLVDVAPGREVVGANDVAASNVLVTLTAMVAAAEGTAALAGGMVGNTTTIDGSGAGTGAGATAAATVEPAVVRSSLALFGS